MAVKADGVVGVFAQTWFDLLSRHAPVEEILPFVIDEGLEMVFPERTLRSHHDFVEWYAAVGASYVDQEHVIEDLTSVEGKDFSDVDVTVLWRAKMISDGSQLVLRAHQSWLLAHPAPGARPVIVKYRVLGMDPA